MKDYISIGSSPVAEDCAQVGSVDYNEQSRIECKLYKEQLERMFPVPKELEGLCYLGIKSFPHDFGSYREVVAYFDDEIQESAQWAYNIEAHGPETWDDIAKQELAVVAFAQILGGR